MSIQLKKLNDFINEVENKTRSNQIGKVWLMDSISSAEDMLSLETDNYKELSDINCPYIFKLVDYEPELSHASGILIKLPEENTRARAIYSVAFYSHQCVVSRAMILPVNILHWYNNHDNLPQAYHGYINQNGELV